MWTASFLRIRARLDKKIYFILRYGERRQFWSAKKTKKNKILQVLKSDFFFLKEFFFLFWHLKSRQPPLEAFHFDLVSVHYLLFDGFIYIHSTKIPRFLTIGTIVEGEKNTAPEFICLTGSTEENFYKSSQKQSTTFPA